MNLQDFIDQYDGAPLDFDDFAEGAVDVTDCESLSHAAETYMLAKIAFMAELGYAGVSIG